ncbi:hypothetical protein J8273_7663 [Carpediemonas membranifera]|uniref:Uncharacterized protein n=1 Tax=Carpediemonas membranifera TaxID=201153 RepID=A0A8J6E190_9EUKA|nr:hypothetical protein J8273_7663 [Carpediemonas membranifera]|eukprot:KAG9390322.1 hypothetical protein J8273_7663 [Carpediemonas membranifera]
MLAEAAAAAFPEGPMAAAAQRRAEAVFTAAVAEIDHNAPVYVPLINKFNPDVPLRDDEYVAEVNAALAPPKPADDEAAATNNSDTSSDESDWDDVTDIRAYLHDEADDIVAACSVTLMPSLDVGARIKSINLPGALYGKASKHRSTIAALREFIDLVNTDASAPALQAIPWKVLAARVRELALKGFSAEAKDYFDSYIIDDAEDIDDVLDNLRDLKEDHDGYIFVPWRAFRTGQPPQPHGEQATGGSRTRKPIARKISGPDPYVQLKDKANYYINPTFRHFCDYHGYNSSHVTQACPHLKTQRSAAPQPSRPIQPAVVGAKPKKAPGHHNNPDRPATTTTQAPKRNARAPNPAAGWTRNKETNRLERLSQSINEVDIDAESDTDESIDEVDTSAQRENIGKPIYHDILVNGTRLRAKLDPAAAKTCISEATFATLKEAGPVMITNHAYTLKMADQRPCEDTTAVIAELVIDGIVPNAVELTWTVPVISGEAHKFLFGADLLRHLGLMSDTGINIQLPPSAEDPADDVTPAQNQYIDEVDSETDDLPDDVSSFATPTFDIDPSFPLHDELLAVLQANADVFDPKLPLGGADIAEATIDLKPDAILCQRGTSIKYLFD